MSGNVLFADNDRDFLDTRAEFLEQTGYRVLKAYNLEQARQLLAEACIHLAILDIRMENDDDEKDISGLTLAKDPAFRPVPKIILTNFPSYQYVREALGPALDGLPPAVDFLAKQEGPEALIQAVERAFAQHVCLNPDLSLRFAGLLSFTAIADIIDPEAQRKGVLLERSAEVEWLFRKLFHDRLEVILVPIGRGRAGTALIQAIPTLATGPERRLIIKCGQRAAICHQRENYRRFVEKFAGALCTEIAGFAETVHFAAIAYALVGGHLEETKPLNDYYLEADSETICKALDRLFHETCGLWYQQNPEPVDKSLNALYREQLALGEADWAQKGLTAVTDYLKGHARTMELADLRYVPSTGIKDPGKLLLTFNDGTTVESPDPIAYTHLEQQQIGPPILLGITHGDLTGDNIRIAKDGRAWLTDFDQTGLGPILRDFARLETAIKLDLTKTGDLHQLWLFERALFSPHEFAAPNIDDATADDLRKAIKVIGHLRQIAGTISGSDLKQYYMSLLYYAIQVLLGKSSQPSIIPLRPEYIRKAHALLATAIACQRLMEWDKAWLPPVVSPPGQPEPATIYIDRSSDVWIKGKKLEPPLPPLEFKLLEYLLSRQGKLCTRDEIIRAIYPDVVQINGISDDAINSVVRRLRKRLEPYGCKDAITTIRGRGYRLEVR